MANWLISKRLNVHGHFDWVIWNDSFLLLTVQMDDLFKDRRPRTKDFGCLKANQNESFKMTVLWFVHQDRLLLP